jgi:hypothetical protein
VASSRQRFDFVTQPHKPLTPWHRSRGPFSTKLGFATSQTGIQELDFRKKLLKQDKPPSIKENEPFVIDYRLLKINFKNNFRMKMAAVGPQKSGRKRTPHKPYQP